MRLFTVPAQYRPFLEAQIRLAVAEIERDADRRADDYEPVRRLATVPDQFLDRTAEGTLTILVGVQHTEPDERADPDCTTVAVPAGATQ